MRGAIRTVTLANALLLSSVASPARVCAEPPKHGRQGSNSINSSPPVSGKQVIGSEAIEMTIIDALARHQIPGAAFAVGRDGEVLYSRGFGFADREKKVGVKPDSLFRIASVSKPITAVALLRLIERGELSLEDIAIKMLNPRLTATERVRVDPRLAQVTLRCLLEHSAGFDRGVSGDPMFRAREVATIYGKPSPATAEDVIRSVLSKPLDFDPGTKYAYSNFGYNLLARVMEVKSKRSYEQIIRDEVITPLGLQDVRLARSLLKDRAPKEVRYYVPGDPTAGSVFGVNALPVPVQYGGWNIEAMDSHGGWLASAECLVQFGLALQPGARVPLLKQQSHTLMLSRPRFTASADSMYYGLGWFVRPIGQSCNFWHTGMLDGSESLLVCRNDGYVWALLLNGNSVRGRGAAMGELDRLLHTAVDDAAARGAWKQRN